MSEEQQQQSQQEQDSTGANWREVGEQFERLGQSLADALRATFSEAEQSGQWERVRTGMESVAREVGQAVEDTAKSPKAQELKVEAQKTVDQLRTAGEQAVQEARPQMASALRQMNVELQKLIDWAEREKKE
ncbi:MAG: hypothetical protein JW987_16845 [Anaerolineaceae bacterium]|nr:hypothetical protein [Anaerolineaceae bacterium]